MAHQAISHIGDSAKFVGLRSNDSQASPCNTGVSVRLGTFYADRRMRPLLC